MILLRLAEDVISMDSNLQSNRKKEITHELNMHAQGLFTFFIETLKTNTAKYRTLKVQYWSVVSIGDCQYWSVLISIDCNLQSNRKK